MAMVAGFAALNFMEKNQTTGYVIKRGEHILKRLNEIKELTQQLAYKGFNIFAEAFRESEGSS